jgi:hypothetical protein
MRTHLYRLAMVLTVLVSSTGLALEAPITIALAGTVSEHKSSLQELDPQWPSDWSSYDYLVVERMRATEACRRSCLAASGGAGKTS